MNNLLGSGSAQLDTFSGTVSFSDPTSLPEGASPRQQNTDFNIGSVYTRPGLVNPFTYQNSQSGPGVGGMVIGGGQVTTNASGSIWFPLSRPLGNSVHGARWNNWSTPFLPNDAVIVAIYPVIVASGVHAGTVYPFIGAAQWMAYGNPDFGGVPDGTPFPTAPGSPGNPSVTFPSTLFTAPSIGSSLSVLSAQAILARLDNSLFEDNLSDFLNVTAVGMGIVYTSVIATVDPIIPPPVTITAGQGLAWSLPQSVATTQPPQCGLLNITSSVAVIEPHTGTSWATAVEFAYDIIFGPTPQVGQQISIQNTTNGTGQYNGVNLLITVASGTAPTGTFTCVYLNLPASPLTPEDGDGLTASTGGSDTGATEAIPATVTGGGGPVGWMNPGRLLDNTGFYAFTTLTATLFAVSSVEVRDFGGMFGTIVTFAQDLPPVVAGQAYAFSGLTTFTDLNGASLFPQLFGLTLAANQQSFLFGSSVYANTADTGAATISEIITPSTNLDINTFGFSIPSSDTPLGFSESVLGYTSAPGATLNLQMLKAGVPVGNIEQMPMPTGAPGTMDFGGINDLFGSTWNFADINAVDFGVRLWVTSLFPGTVYLSFLNLTVFFAPTQVNFNYVTTFEDNFGTIRTLALDSSGQWWVENVSTNPGKLVTLFNGPPPNSYASSFTADSRQYIAISDLTQGDYPPQQYTGQWNDRVSQVGPGQAPNFTGIVASGDTFSITNITQPTQKSQGSSYFLQSTGPGATAAGNVVTIYYLDSTIVSGPDADLVAAFNSGFPVYLYLEFAGTSITTQGPYVQQVTAVGLGSPPGQPRAFYYFTYSLSSVASQYFQGSGHPSYTVTYQRSLATQTMAVPVPGLVVGNQITDTGVTPSNWNSNWTITQALNSGQFTITQTSTLAGVATYSYTLISGAVPAAGQTVTVTGTLNDNGTLNVVNAAIVSASGGSSGTFTVNVSGPDATAVSESGQATTAGTVFTFDPGAALVGSSTNPIYGTGTGGTMTFAGPNGQFIGPGTRQGTVFFITRNGYWTRPAPPITFDITENTISIQASNIPIGPPNVIARAIAFTEGGNNGVPGANFFTIPQPVKYIVEGITYTASSLFINDNTTTGATFSFPDATLLNATAIDVQGFNLFQLEELGDPAWCVQYAGRTAWGRVRNQIQLFQNMSFDGGYLANPGGAILPLGWQVDSASAGFATLQQSPVFGDSYYIKNTSGSTKAVLGMIYQTAYQNYNNTPILQNQIAYSVRVTARTPSSATNGNLVVDLTAYDIGTGFGTIYGSFILPLSSMSSTMATYEGTLLVTDTLNIPPDLVIRYWAQNLLAGGDLEIDRISVFPTEEPTNLTAVQFSYGIDPAEGVSDPEAFDGVTSRADTQTVNSQPSNGAFTLRGLLYVAKESSLGYLKDTPNQEPQSWTPFEEVSNVAGACGIYAYTVDKHKGEEWAAMACQNGLFLFNGGAPIPINLEIQEIWASINWNNAEGLAICNDIANRRIYCAIPLPTPNPWMVTTEVNSAPTTPNVVMMLNYDGIGTIDELMAASSLHVTMTGNLAVHDVRRKYSLWTIPTPYIGLVKRSELRNLMMFCNGIASSKIYYLSDDQTGFDDGVPFTSSYCTYGFVDSTRAQSDPMFGMYNKRYRYWDALVNGSGTASLTFYQNVLQAPYPFVVPGGVELTGDLSAPNDLEGDLDEYAQRMFVEIVMTNGWFNWSRMTLAGGEDKWAAIRGR